MVPASPQRPINMKRFLQLLPALLVVGYVQQASAMSEQCTTVLALPPISTHYTQRVLNRATAGITYARAAAISTDFTQYLPYWAQDISTGAAYLLDSQLRVSAPQQDLLANTACLRFDLLLLECKMEEVRDELNAQLDRGSFFGIVRLQSLQRFLNERYRHLALGALDPTHPDPGWGQLYEFDNPTQVWCCPGNSNAPVCEHMTGDACNDAKGKKYFGAQACAQSCGLPEELPPGEGTMCPYNADYAPPFPDGFGCDAETMRGSDPDASRLAFAPLKDEHDALALITQQVDAYREAARKFLQVQQKIDAIYDRSSTLPPPPPPRSHVPAFGCSWEGGYCSDEPQVRCTQNGDCSSGLCEIPDGVCSGNRVRRCFDSSQCEGAGVCERGEEARTPSSRELRGPFSVDKNHLQILSEFMDVRTIAGLSRSFVDDLKNADEFAATQSDNAAQREREERSGFLGLLRGSVRLLFQTWSRIQGREEGGTFPVVIDPQLETANSLHVLNKAVRDLSKLSAEKEGLRRFVLRFAWYLRRTCMDRPCSLSLEQIIKIAGTDECFPYTNGTYLNDSVQNPRWQQCMKAAGIEL